MENLINYVKGTQNITYKEMAFNEIDAAVYSALIYLDFSYLNNKQTTISDAYSKYTDRFFLKVKDKFKENNKELLKEMANSKRYQNNIIINYQKIVNKETQFGAYTIKVPHQFKIIVFEGTDDSLIGWEENFKMAYTYPIKAQELAILYLNKNINLNDYLVFVAGHSKGGNLAIAASMMQNILKRAQIKYIFNFDGPGFDFSLIDENKYNKIVKKIRSYYPQESVVGMIFKTLGKKKIVLSDSHKINQHDLHTWKLENNKFKTSNLSDYSKNFKRKINKIITNFTKEEKEKFVTSLFKVLYTSGYVYKSDLDKLSITRINKVIKETINLKEDEKKIIIDIFKILLDHNNEGKTEKTEINLAK